MQAAGYAGVSLTVDLFHGHRHSICLFKEQSLPIPNGEPPTGLIANLTHNERRIMPSASTVHAISERHQGITTPRPGETASRAATDLRISALSEPRSDVV